jgi:hypothetical protein
VVFAQYESFETVMEVLLHVVDKQKTATRKGTFQFSVTAKAIELIANLLNCDGGSDYKQSAGDLGLIQVHKIVFPSIIIGFLDNAAILLSPDNAESD